MLSLESRSPFFAQRVTNLESEGDNHCSSTMSGSASDASPQGTLTDAQRSVNDLAEQAKTLRKQIRFVDALFRDSTAWGPNRLFIIEPECLHLFSKASRLPTKNEVEAVVVKLKEEYKVCDPCFPHPLLILSFYVNEPVPFTT